MTINIVVPMAGLGSRLPVSVYRTIKPLIPINGTAMIRLVVDSLNLDGRYIFIYRRDEYSIELEKVIGEMEIPAEFVVVEELTKGPADTCLAARELINNDSELVIANADQIMWWNSNQFLSSARSEGLDGVIVTYSSTSERNSFARLSRNGLVTEVREKEVISEIALAGIHYWRKGKDFIRSAEKMISEGRYALGEFYVGPTYNLMIESGAKIGIYHIPGYQHNPVGIPEDLEKYKEKICKNSN
jgi:dTDP-glucose pyrophosphorylase